MLSSWLSTALASWFILLPLVLLAGFFLLIWLLPPHLIFQPPAVSYRPDNQLRFLDAPSVAGKPHRLAARYLKVEGARFTILYHHGNAVDLGGLQQLQAQFARQGYSSLFYDYSGYGLSEGQSSEHQTRLDARAAYDYLRHTLHVPAERIVLFGHSLGSAVAVELASRVAAAGLVLESPLLSAYRVQFTSPWILALLPFDRFKSIDKIARLALPVLVVHSRDDPVIPVSHGKMLYRLAREPKQLVLFDHAGHAGITHQERFWSVLRGFLNTLTPI